MARGKSGRVVLEIDTALKRNLYLVLEKNETTLKEWFVNMASSYVTKNLHSLNEHFLIAEKNENSYLSQENI
ncbi:hypothetical protein M3194_27925 [Paenibacillus glycanilyticus]|uniref:hypothetical protein n=1 Tax=Paenibacillus glycanilyticus TaxID=126569 RepID=UPI00203CB08B|nr:hypothetical protein [Paenibacillus glycanilyticus]MCM3631146.1 hypothetical protein [Paenibacillus glycanilyticus]